LFSDTFEEDCGKGEATWLLLAAVAGESGLLPNKLEKSLFIPPENAGAAGFKEGTVEVLPNRSRSSSLNDFSL